MRDDCTFCQMIAGNEEYVSVYEDDKVLAIMDMYPINPGHMLVLPKKHVADFYTLDADLYSHVMDLARELAGVLDYIYEPEKMGLLIAGFDIEHCHVHLVPMHNFHDITSKKILEGQRGDPTRLELQDRASEIRDVVDSG